MVTMKCGHVDNNVGQFSTSQLVTVKLRRKALLSFNLKIREMLHSMTCDEEGIPVEAEYHWKSESKTKDQSSHSWSHIYKNTSASISHNRTKLISHNFVPKPYGLRQSKTTYTYLNQVVCLALSKTK